MYFEEIEDPGNRRCKEVRVCTLRVISERERKTPRHCYYHSGFLIHQESTSGHASPENKKSAQTLPGVERVPNLMSYAQFCSFGKSGDFLDNPARDRYLKLLKHYWRVYQFIMIFKSSVREVWYDMIWYFEELLGLIFFGEF